MDLLNIFSADAFGLVSMTDAINRLPHVPGLIGSMGLFEEEGITTTTVQIEEDAGALALVPTALRGGPASQNKDSKRTVRGFAVPHVPLEDTIAAHEVMGVRAFGSSELQTVQAVVNRRMARMNAKHDATLEYHRVGAIKGTILDADGSTLFNLFTEFGVSQTSIDFVLGTTTTNVKDKCLQVARAIEDELGMASYTGITAICGKTFFTEFISHPEVKSAYEHQFSDANKKLLAGNSLRKGFEYGDITWMEYRGKVGATSFVADAECHFIVQGVPGLFKTYFAPADFVETVNTIGLPRYAKTAVDPEFQRWVKLHTQQNPMNLCLRPKVLVKGTTSN